MGRGLTPALDDEEVGCGRGRARDDEGVAGGPLGHGEEQGARGQVGDLVLPYGVLFELGDDRGAVEGRE